MVIKPVEFGMIEQSELVSAKQAAENNRPIANQSSIQTTIEQKSEIRSETVNEKDNIEFSNEGFDAKEKSNNEYSKDQVKRNVKERNDGRVFIKGQGSTDFDIKI